MSISSISGAGRPEWQMGPQPATKAQKERLLKFIDELIQAIDQWLQGFSSGDGSREHGLLGKKIKDLVVDITAADQPGSYNISFGKKIESLLSNAMGIANDGLPSAPNVGQEAKNGMEGIMGDLLAIKNALN